jgi:hypothetical protein
MALVRTPGRKIAAGVLCAVAATVALWSGPLASATTALHTSASTPAHVAAHASAQAARTVR